jgi:hypothetical protein
MAYVLLRVWVVRHIECARSVGEWAEATLSNHQVCG